MSTTNGNDGGQTFDDLRRQQLHVGVGSDGDLDDCAIVTTMRLPLAVYQRGEEYEIDHENRFAAFRIDDGPGYIEVRLPFEVVEDLAKWIKEPPDSVPSLSKGGA